MNTQTVQSAALSHGRDALDALKVKAIKFKDANIPRAASALETAGQTLADATLSSSKSLAKSLRARKTRRSRLAVLSAAPLIRAAGRFALRNPLLIAAAGAAIAYVGYSAWQRDDVLEDDEHGALA